MRLEHGDFAEASSEALTPGAVRDWTGDPTFGSQVLPPGWKRSWNAPACDRCWVERRGYLQPVRAVDPQERGARTCAFCGRPTWAQIVLRADPAEVPYPPLEPIG